MFGLLAWVLVRDDFANSGSSIVLSIYGALPTIVASLVILALTGTARWGLHFQHTATGVRVAVRSSHCRSWCARRAAGAAEIVAFEEAAASLGANGAIFTSVVLPRRRRVARAGGLAFSRAIGERFGSVVPDRRRLRVPRQGRRRPRNGLHLIENDDRTGAAAISTARSRFRSLCCSSVSSARVRRTVRRWLHDLTCRRLCLVRSVALGYVFVLLIVPVALIL